MILRSLSAISHILEHKPRRIRSVTFNPKSTNSRVQEIMDLAKKQKVRVMSGTGEPQAEIEPFEFADLKDCLTNSGPTSLLLALDHLQDPQNFGALCRSADALGVSAILLPQDRSVGVTEGVYSASAGAVETVPVVLVANLRSALERCKSEGFWILGASLSPSSQSIFSIPRYDKTCLVLGSELDGLSKHVEKNCDLLVHLPMKGTVASLNVSVAGALLLFKLGS